MVWVAPMTGSIPELSVVVLRHRVESEGEVLAEGRRGTVVHAWDDGKHYLVEFPDEDATDDWPTSHVVDVERGDIQLA